MNSGDSTATTYSLRPATEDDLPTLAEIEKRVHVAPWTTEQFQEELEKPYSQFLLLTDDETDAVIAGYCVAWKLFDEFQLLNIAVDLPHRGLGYAKRMLNHLASQAHREGLKRVILDVRKSNLAAISLYQRCGFSIAHIRKGFYSNGEDAYQMALDLSELGKVLSAHFDTPES
jgi:ribosomal-protein-alanine N-acetyltransferase